MDNPEYHQLRETAWRRDLTPEESEQLKRTLAARPQANEDLELEGQLTRALRRMPNAQVSSNFTARVMQQAARAPIQQRRWSWKFALPKWAPRLALGTLMVCAGLFSVKQYHSFQQARMARNLVSVGQLASLPDTEWLDNFETIDRMGRVEVADNELLSTLR